MPIIHDNLIQVKSHTLDLEGTLSLRALESRVYQDSLKQFVHEFWAIVEPSTSLSWNWHLDELCNVLTLCKLGKIKKLIVNVPPGTMKSMLISVFFNAWIWAYDASKRFLTASYSSDNTVRDNLRLKDIIRSERYYHLFWLRDHIGLSSSQDAKERFDTTLKGYRIASSVKGTFLGEHPDFIIIDDPLKAQDALSETKIDECNTWLRNTVSTRQAKDPCVILVMQRLAERDASGFLMKLGGWETVIFPMKYESSKIDDNDPRNIPDSRDHRNREGELLWPEIWTEKKVKDEEILLGPFASGQLQQYPIPIGGALFKRDWFPVVDAAPVNAERCRGWDIAETDLEESLLTGRGDETWGVKLAYSSEGIIYVEDAIWDQIVIVDKLMKQTAELDGYDCKIREGAGSGKATIAARSRLLAGYDYDKSPESDNKIARANPFRAQAEAGNVRLVRGDWNEAYLNRVCAFPFGKYDDPVDATSNAANELLGCVRVTKKRVRTGW